MVVLAFSGGGTRAAAFSYGVLKELARYDIDGGSGGEYPLRSLLGEVDHVTAVSGGSFTAAYFGLYGEGIFDHFEERFLKRNIQTALLARMFLLPWSWTRLLSPYYGRTDLAAEFYDKHVFGGATFADLEARRGPLVQINTTDMATGSPFAFIQDQFDFICSDLSAYPIGRAVAASSAVPGLLTPLTLKNFGGRCGFDPPNWIMQAIIDFDSFDREYVNAQNLASYLDGRKRRYIRLVDGGISDNLGVRGPFEARSLHQTISATRPERMGKLRNMVLIVANASTAPENAWERADVLPALALVLKNSTNAQIKRYNIETMELLRSNFALWNERAANWATPLRFHLVELDFTKLTDPAERTYINSLPTSFSLAPEAVDRLKDAASTIMRESNEFKELLESIGATRNPEF